MSKSSSSKKKNKTTKHTHHITTVKGTLEITRSGIGYVLIEDKSGDVLVRPGDFNTALNGDVVRVRIVKENLASKRKEGRITEVVTRLLLSQVMDPIRLSALGRDVRVGNLYKYHNDNILRSKLTQ